MDDQPTVVRLTWTADGAQTTQVAYGVNGELDQETTAVTEGPDHEVLLLGLPALADVSIRAVADDGKRERVCEAEVTTDGMPPDAPSFDVWKWEPEQADDFRWLLAAVIGEDPGVIVIDRQGARVWFLETSDTDQIIDVQMAFDGNDILYNIMDVNRTEDISRVVRVGIDGRPVEEIVTPKGHHVFAQTETHLAWLSADIRRWEDPELGELVPVVGDAIFERRLSDGVITPIWSSWDHWEPEEHEHWDSGFYPLGADWTHANSLHLVPERDSWLVSLAHLQFIVEVERSTGSILRQYGGEKGYVIDGGETTLVRPHDPTFTEDGTLLVVVSDEDDTETRVVEFAVDSDARTLEEVWSYGEGVGFHAWALGQAVRLDNGNTLVNFGTAGVLQEVTPAGEVVWELATESGSWFGQVRPIHDLYEGR